ncbi:ras-associated and pleckstrin homology domains-containing protein 1a isoform X1 [Triplophysa dalaica]|uniref:ras-associated and pleckstrin homology domains-containing protein 1a isoform X1 n=1 Tax=Triplophysa dalaica TaxID=1582913 RepID=UPI0024DF504D|nr:ras-associated and pleckstrin homology domains-containing protein 1a isoform X1 [Triplophysa dalaica]XP_056610961.1 ras-associated and pleckstrin homology domains-containing protein 1a isoform X1 [Triplophysa dalaica]XP_056610962.1 ras-associated and pleckstrin homology domains-containing protein 1a isoform X1 [Triplophysa dalaica]
MEQFSDDELDHAAEEDSDKEDQDLDKMFGAWLGELDKLTKSLDDGRPEKMQKAPLRQESNMANMAYRFSVYNINEALNQGDSVDLDALMADLCSIEQELSTIGKPSGSSRLGIAGDAKIRQKPPAGRSHSTKHTGGSSSGGASSSGGSTSSSTRASPASTVRVGTPSSRPPLASNFSLDDITAQLEKASQSMDEAARQSTTSLSSTASAPYSTSTVKRPASHHHRRTGSVGTVTEHDVRSFVHSSRSSINSASASSMDSLDIDKPKSDQDGVRDGQEQPSSEHSYLDRETSLILKSIAGKPSHLLTKEEQAAKLKADNIRVALEKIKEAQVKKLVIRVHLSDESSKTMMVDERQTVRQVLDSLLDKSHCGYSLDWSLVEIISELQIERIFEDHENLVENLLNWTRDSTNRLMFIERIEKYALFKNPQNYLLGRKETCEMADRNKEALLEECFCGSSVSVPEMEGVLWLKDDGKKSWKKRYFLLRASGIYYVPKGKAKASRDLVCFLQLEHVNVYLGQDYRSKYKAPTDYCMVLKHPQIQKKSQYIKYLCCEDVRTLHQWINGIRIAKYGKQLYVNYQEAMRRTEAAHDWSSLSSSSMKSGSSSSSLPESQSNHSSQSDSGVSETLSSAHIRSQSVVSSIFSEAWKRGNQTEDAKMRMESSPGTQPARASYPLQLPQPPQMPQSTSRNSYTGVSPVSSPSPPSPPPPPPPPPPLPNPTHHSTPVLFTKFSTIARLQNISQAPNHYKQTPLLAAQQQQQFQPPTPPPQCLKPVVNNIGEAGSAPPPPPPPPPPPEMPVPGSAMAVLKHGPVSPHYVPLPPSEEDQPPPPSHLHSNGFLPPPPPPEQLKFPSPLSTNGLQQFLAQKFPNMTYDFSPDHQDEEHPPPPPPPPLPAQPPVCFLPQTSAGPPPAPPKTFSIVFPPQTAPKPGQGLSPVSPFPPPLSPTPSATIKKQQSLSSGHSPNQPPPTLPKQYSLSSKTPPVSAPISPTQSIVKQIVNQFPDSLDGSKGPSLPVVKGKPKWQPGGQAQAQSPEFPPPPPESSLDFPPPPPPSPPPAPPASGKIGSPIKKSPSTSSNSSTGSGSKKPPPTPQRNSSVKGLECQESKKVEDLVSMFAQTSQAPSNSFSTPSSTTGSPSKDSAVQRTPPKPGKINLANLPLALQGKPSQYRQSGLDFPSPPPECEFPPPPPDSELLPPPPLPSELHAGAPKVAVVNPQPQLSSSTSSWKQSSLKKTLAPTMHRRSSGPPEPLALSPPPQQMPVSSFNSQIQPTSPKANLSVQPNFLEDLNRTLKRKSMTRHGSLTSSRISAKFEPVATMDDMALPPPPPELLLGQQKKGGYAAANISGYATLRRGPPPAPPKRDQNTKLTSDW